MHRERSACVHAMIHIASRRIVIDKSEEETAKENVSFLFLPSHVYTKNGYGETNHATSVKIITHLSL